MHWLPGGQVPQDPPHPSGPHFTFWQDGMQPGTQRWPSHESPGGHWPHDPPHPSSPHCLGVPSGFMHEGTHPPQKPHCWHSWMQTTSHDPWQQ